MGRVFQRFSDFSTMLNIRSFEFSKVSVGSIGIGLALCTGFAVQASAIAAGSVGYTLKLLADDGQGSTAWALNTAGTVVGYSEGGGLQGEVWKVGVRQPHTLSQVWGINKAGKIVGQRNGRASLFYKLKYTDLGATGAAVSISDNDKIAGTSADGLAWFWSAGQLASLPLPEGATSANPYAVNAASTVVGTAYRSGKPVGVQWTGAQHAATFLEPYRPDVWDGGSAVYGMNAEGESVGISIGASDAAPEIATRWLNVGPQVLGYCNGYSTRAFGIRAGAISATGVVSPGQVVGWTVLDRTGPARVHATIWKWVRGGYQCTDLNTYVSQAEKDAGWILQGAFGINAKGWIAGRAYNQNTGVTRAFLLTTP
jgi:hypothetical protein